MTVFDSSPSAYSLPGPLLTGTQYQDHAAGKQEFETHYSPEPGVAYGGLGPGFNAPSCSSCHVRNGRGRPPLSGNGSISFLLKMSLPGTSFDGAGAPLPVPGYGGQLTTLATAGRMPEGTVSSITSEYAMEADDGQPYHYRFNKFSIEDPYMTLPGDLQVSMRISLPLHGIGLLLAVDEATILQFADEIDVDGDGISGRPNYVWDPLRGERRLGRLGWKAGTANLRQLVAVAFQDDLGVTNVYFPEENTVGTPLYDGIEDEPEMGSEAILLIETYLMTVGVPAPRNLEDPTIQRGRLLFESVGCTGCHVPELRTGTVAGLPALSNQRIFPYTDLLLHDMGFELADGRPEFEATSREWRTSPLWGIGLMEIVNENTYYLHDGRAETLSEAIVWHAGEGEDSKVAFLALPRADREALLAFLRSL